MLYFRHVGLGVPSTSPQNGSKRQPSHWEFHVTFPASEIGRPGTVRGAATKAVRILRLGQQLGP